MRFAHNNVRYYIRLGRRELLHLGIGEFANDRAVGRVPELDHAVARTAGDELAVLGEDGAEDLIVVPFREVLVRMGLELAHELARNIEDPELHWRGRRS